MIHIHGDGYSAERVRVSLGVHEYKRVHEILEPISHHWVSGEVHTYSIPRDVAVHALALIVATL